MSATAALNVGHCNQLPAAAAGAGCKGNEATDEYLLAPLVNISRVVAQLLLPVYLANEFQGPIMPVFSKWLRHGYTAKLSWIRC